MRTHSGNHVHKLDLEEWPLGFQSINTSDCWRLYWNGDCRMTMIRKFLKDQSGATAIEYGLAAVLVSIVAIVGMSNTGQEVNALYADVEGAVSTAAPAP